MKFLPAIGYTKVHQEDVPVMLIFLNQDMKSACRGEMMSLWIAEALRTAWAPYLPEGPQIPIISPLANCVCKGSSSLGLTFSPTSQFIILQDLQMKEFYLVCFNSMKKKISRAQKESPR